jgi:basic membrane protein A and related proteins
VIDKSSTPTPTGPRPRRRRLSAAAAAAGGLALATLALTACGSSASSGSSAASGSSSTATTSTGSASGSNSSFSACLMISSDGVADHSFNQAAWQALTEAQSKLGITVKYLAQSGSIDYPAIGAQFVSAGCTMIIGEGFNTATAIESLAKANPAIKFVLIDDTLTTPEPNATSLTYQTDQAGFLGGYLAAGMSKSGTVGIYGNEPIPPVELYMNGYVYGVEYYNSVHKTKVQVIGWNPASKSGQFVGDFTNVTKGKLITEAEIQQGADVIFPVAGPIDEGTATALQAAGGPAKGYYEEWVDSDGCETNPSACGVILSTVQKNIQPSLYSVISETVGGKFPTGSYVGTLTNDGVGLAPFHQLASKVPATLQSEITKLRRDLVAGTVKVQAY